MSLPIVVAIFLGTWGLPPSLQPQPAQGVEKQGQPTQHDGSAEPSAKEQKTESDQRTAKKEHDQSRIEKIMKFVREYNAEIVAISTAIMGLFTIALFIATWLLYWGGERHSERELRAYVFPISVKVTNFQTPTPLLAVVQIRNSGQTPAYRLTCTTRLIICPFPNTDFNVPQSFNLEYLGPRGKVWRTARTRAALTNDQEQQIVNGNFSIHVFGRIDYTDAFGSPRWTTFRTIARGENGGMLTEPDKPDTLIMSFDSEGNEAT